MSDLVEKREQDLLLLELNAPDRANALSPALISALTEVYVRDLRGEGVRAVLLTAAGRHFSAGADLEHLKSLRDAGKEENLADSHAIGGLFSAVLRQPALTIAAVQGACVAGGCGLATAHDFVVAAHDSRFMYSEVRIGFVAALVATFLPLRVRGSDVRELLLNPEFVGAEKALELGLVNRVVESMQLINEAKALAVEILEKASSESIARTKQLLLDTIGRSLGAALDLAAEVNAASRETEDCKTGIATFLETKAAPKWR